MGAALAADGGAILQCTCMADLQLNHRPRRSTNPRSGRYEVWRDGTIKSLDDGSLGLVPNGGWIVWDMDGDCLLLGFPKLEHAEMMAVYRNEGAETRIKDPWGGELWSTLDFQSIKAKVDKAMDHHRATNPLFKGV